MDVLFDGTLLQEFGKSLRCLNEMSIIRIGAYHDTARIQIVVQGFRLTQEFRTKDDVLGAGLLANGLGISNWNRGLNDHNRIRIDLHHQIDNGFHGRRIEEVLLAVIIGGGSDDYKISVSVSRFAIKSGGKIQLLLCEVFLDVIILNRRFTRINHIDLFGDDINRSDLMMLRKQDTEAKAHISCTSNSYLE